MEPEVNLRLHRAILYDKLKDCASSQTPLPQSCPLVSATKRSKMTRIRSIYFFFAVFFGVAFFSDFFTPHPGFPQDISHLSYSDSSRIKLSHA